MNNDTNNNAKSVKFTAALVDETTKTAIVELRNETGLSEKQLMRTILGVVTAQREQLLAIANEIKTRNEQERAERKAAAYAQLKQKLAQSRKAKAKPSKKAPKTDAEVEAAA